MGCPLSQFIEHHAQLFREGRIEEMLDDCAYPLPVQGRDGMRVLATRDMYRSWLQNWQRDLGKRQMRESRLRIHTLELPRSGRFRVWIERSFENDGHDRVDLDVIYYCRFDKPRPVIEMIEFGAPPEPAD
ncbi:hypothetical protein FHS00_001169 [Limimaricola variabilis]|jgi:hypothetical protein|uniref:Nuclear transport factor 2 family protein n=1 Tax=Limimaricola variabilis TaxID=1492771 RepID=A0ABR6HMD6_9RHOB|nr:hypothetical protein [Limimaricola variabilis]MBB3711598.1 hypothetical protein [Limimaricola variabilis]WPY94565.1 hypothetical protein T8T21_00095 [Limimaricola variabilis]